VREVDLGSEPLDRLAGLLTPERRDELTDTAYWAQEMLQGRTMWHVNATASGGGVAEMLQALLAYTKGAGVDTRWLVLHGSPEFFTLTKRIHNKLHGSPGDGGDLGEKERKLYETVLSEDIDDMVGRVRDGDIVVLHDPQTAGMVDAVKAAGAHVIWRCHVGKDDTDEHTDQAWSLLRPYVERADAVIFTRQAYVPDWVDPARCRIIPPSIDPYSAKNIEMSPEDVAAVLKRAGLVDIHDGHAGSHTYRRRDGGHGEVREFRGLIHGDQVVPEDARVALQVSRWDRLKDMDGVLRAFADNIDSMPPDVHLMLVGPDVSGVSDDPEGAEVFAECQAIWAQQDPAARARMHLCSLPMDDVDENARIVNALQRHASVVVQKSLVEGFGLTVTEPMWKGRPVLATRVGGIQDQIVDGESGLLLDDPHDLDTFARLLGDLLSDHEQVQRLGPAACERVRDRYLGDQALVRYAHLLRDLER
jgi:trehalose synthase